MPFDRMLGAWAFIALVPFIILYLRRPKPSVQTVPSLMFFMRDRGSAKMSSFFQKLTSGFLFLLQLLILSILAFSIMGFFIEVPAEKAGKLVIVLDVSASMQSSFEQTTRFEAAVKEAVESASGRVSIVFSSNVPRVVLEDGRASEARRILLAARPVETSSNIGDAMLVARDIVDGRGRIVVLSDFIATEGVDPFVARSLMSQEIAVTFVNFGGGVDNVAIVSLEPNKRTTAATIKNFADRSFAFEVQIINNGEVKDGRKIELAGNSVEEFVFDTLPGRTEVKLIVDDDMWADNSAFLSVPENSKIKTLLITNGDSSNVRAALEASPDVVLDVANPPVVNGFDYDVIILHEFETGRMLPGFYKEIENSVNEGSSLIITAQEDLGSAGIKLLPVSLKGFGNGSRNLVNVTNYFTKDVDFGVNERYLVSEAKPGTSVVVSSGGSPVVAVAAHNRGKVVYYGILDDFSSFKSSTTYPQFWNRLLNFLAETEALDGFNFKTGRIEATSSQLVSTPSGAFNTGLVLFDNVGFYSYDGKTFAANLLDVRESDVSSDLQSFEREYSQVLVEKSDLKERRNYELYLAVIVAVLIFLELVYVKFRGDL